MFYVALASSKTLFWTGATSRIPVILSVYANDGRNIVRQQHQNIEGSDRLQIIDLERSRSTSELA